MNAIYPDQRVSSTHKMNNKVWARDMCEYVIKLARSHNDKTKIKEFLASGNAEISEKKYKYLLAKYEGDKEMQDSIAQIREVDFLTPIKEKFMGEFINSYHNYQAFVHDPDVIFRRNQELGEQVYTMIMQELINKMNEAGIETNQESQEMPDPQVFIDEKLKEWRNNTAMDAQHILDYLNDITHSKDKYLEAFYYFFVTNQCVTYRRIQNNEVYFEVKSPLEYYRVESGNQFIEDDDYGMCWEKVSFNRILDEARDMLSRENIAFLETLTNSIRPTLPIEATYEMLKSRVWMFDEKREYAHDFRVTFSDKFFLVNRYHVVFKTPVKQGILTYMNQEGSIEQMIVDETYKKDEEAGDIELKWEYVNQVWEMWRYGDDQAAIYTKPRPVEVQREFLGNNSVCKLPYNGVTWLNRHSKPNPIPYRLIDYLALYRIYTLQQERWVNKFKSWITFPETLLADSSEMNTAERISTADADGIFTYNDNINENPNVVNQIKEVATSAVVDYIKVLGELREQVKQEAMALASWTPSRDGDVNPRQGKAVTEHSLAQSTNAAAWLYSVFNAMRERDYLANLDYSKFAWIDGKQGAYIDPNTNKIVEVNIDGATHASQNYGVAVRNSAQLNEMFQSMKDLAFAAAQGGEFAMAADAIISNNIFETKDIINKHVEASRAFQQQLKEMETQGIIEAKQIEQETQRERNEAIIQAEDVKGQYLVRVAEIAYERELDKEEMRLLRDLDGNGYISKEEAEAWKMGDGQRGALDLLQQQRLKFEREKEAFNQMDKNRNFKLKEKAQKQKAKAKK